MSSCPGQIQTAANDALRVSRGGMLDALRFLAALFIVVFHFGDQAPVPLRLVHDVFSRGYLATDFFLMLSGFILAYAYGGAIVEGRVSPVQFLTRRLARTYPAHLITLGLLVVLVLLATAIGHPPSHPERFVWSAIPAHVLLVHAWGFAPGTWNAPSWTLSALLVCYAAFPWLWLLLRRLRTPAACLGLVLGLLIGSDVLAHLLLHSSQFNLPFRLGLLRAIPLFVTGVALARLVQTLRPSPAAGRIAALCGAGGLLLNLALAGSDVVSMLLICAVIAGCGGSGQSRPWPGAAWGAKVSFSLFITHTVSGMVFFDSLLPVLRKLHPGLVGGWAIWLGSLVFAIAAAAAFDRFVDTPVQGWLKNALAKRSPVRPKRGRAETTALAPLAL